MIAAETSEYKVNKKQATFLYISRTCSYHLTFVKNQTIKMKQAPIPGI